MADRDSYDKSIVRSLDKGLAVIEALNVEDGQSIQEIATSTGINRAIVYRLLETLRRRGYISKSPGELRYWLEPMVQALASGYRNEAWIREIVEPACKALGRDLTWPINFTTYARKGMVVRACSDYESPLTVDKIPVGYCIPVFSSSTGRAYIAWCSPAERSKLMELLFPDADSEPQGIVHAHDVSDTMLRDYDRNRRRERSYFSEANLEAVKAVGYDQVTYTPRGLPHRTVISAPVFANARIIGVLSLRCYTLALAAPGVPALDIEALLATAAAIGEKVSQQASAAAAP